MSLSINNPTDTNQASEDELEHELDDIVHDALGEVFCGDCEHPRCLNKVKLYKKTILALIRTEKLKLLDEVRERVVGDYEDTQKWEDPIDRQVADECNQLRAEMRTILTKLEAEL